MPTRNPVNDPGPMPTAMPDKSFSVMPACAMTSAVASGIPAPCEAVERVSSARTFPLQTTARDAVALALSSPSTGPTLAPSSNSFSALNNSRDVIENDERHQGDQQKQSYLQRHLPGPKFQRFAAQSLEREEQQMPAVEQRYREQVNDSE